MLHFDIPADELCLHACGLFLNIHITVDYHFGHWSTLDVSGTSHDLVASLSDVHLVYMGEGHYTLLCKFSDNTTSIKEFNKNNLDWPQSTQNTAPAVKHSQGITETVYTQEDVDISGVYSDMTDLYNQDENNTSSETIIYTMDTEIYALEDYSIDVPIKNKTKTEVIKGSKSKNSVKRKLRKPKSKSRPTTAQQSHLHPLFRCSKKTCGVRKQSRKEITHYVTKHNEPWVCNVCNKKYCTPHSLQQHKYYHMRMSRNFTCTRCNASFPFLSQLKIHRLKHTRKQKYKCTEFSELFKYKHDMLKHLREHTAPILKCMYCDYTGTKLRLSAHEKQHDPSTYMRCILCNDLFVHCMSYWRHQQICKRSGSPEY